MWKADGEAQTGFSDLHGPFGPGVAFPSRVRVTDRAYPVYLAGTLRGLSYDPNTAGVDLRPIHPAWPPATACTRPSSTCRPPRRDR